MYIGERETATQKNEELRNMETENMKKYKMVVVSTTREIREVTAYSAG